MANINRLEMNDKLTVHMVTQERRGSPETVATYFASIIYHYKKHCQTTSKKLTISIFAPRIFLPTSKFKDKEDFGRGIL